MSAIASDATKNNGRALRILFVEDSPDDVALMVRALESAGYEITYERVDSEPGLERAISHGFWDAIIADLVIPSFGGMEALAVARVAAPHTPFILVTGAIGEEKAAFAIKRGASDFLLKTNIDRLPPILERAIVDAENRRRRAEAEAALWAQEARYRRLLELVTAGVFEIDLTKAGQVLADLQQRGQDNLVAAASAVEHVRVLSVSDVSKRIFRASDLEALLAPTREPLRGIWKQILVLMSQKDGPVQIEADLIAMNGESISVVAGLTIPSRSEDLASVVVTMLDVTETRRLERRLRAAQRMEALGQLTAGIAHDFNNVISVIESYGRFVFDAEDATEQIREDAQVIRDTARRAASMVRQLLAYTRQQFQELEILDINRVVRDTEGWLERVIGEDIELVTKLDPSLGSVRVDPSQLDQILLNLIVNAREAMPGGGKIVVETRSVELDESYSIPKGVPVPPGRYTLLSVTDTGHGMDAETRARIFQPFFTTKKGKGSGLGLSTVYGIVKQSRGFIWVYSEPRVGTSFNVYLPVVADEQNDRGSRRSYDGALDGDESILVVEDHSFVRRALERFLKKHGYKVLLAGDGEEALRLAAGSRESIDLLLTDLVMPGMNGAELATALRKITPEVRCLFMSGFADQTAESLDLLEHGAAFVQKPFSEEHMLRKIRLALSA